MENNLIDVIGLFILISGFIIGLGAVTVIDLHGLLGIRSKYWTEATTRTHKITKPLIWVGIVLCIVGGAIFYRNQGFNVVTLIHLISALILLINGIFLSFSVSPFLINREKEGKAADLLPSIWQKKIAISFVISFIGWWGNLLLLVWKIAARF